MNRITLIPPVNFWLAAISPFADHSRSMESGRSRFRPVHHSVSPPNFQTVEWSLVWLMEYKPQFGHPFLFRTPLVLPAGTIIQGVPKDASVFLLPASLTPKAIEK
jgi:hypothetical protein